MNHIFSSQARFAGPAQLTANIGMTHGNLASAFGRLHQATIRAGLIAVLSIVGAASTSALADDEIPTGFYAATQKACFEATGQLLQCKGGHCTFQEYQSSVGTGEPVQADVSATVASGPDRNGFELASGDAILNYKQFGADNVRVVRPDGRTITTTYLARTDSSGKVTFAFLENGISKDPSVKPQMLSRCEAYDIDELAQILSNGGPPKAFPKIETLVPPGLPLKFDYANADQTENAGVLANIPILATAPREDAYIVEAVPVPGRNPDYPDIMVLWTVAPGSPTPIQFLSYDPTFRAYVDKTTGLLAPGSSPLVDNPGAVPVGSFIDGRPSIFIGNGGIDAKPWSGSLDTLLVQNENYQWEDRSASLPRRAGWSHDAALGRISANGDAAIYVAKIDSTPGAGSQILEFGSDVTEVSESAAPSGLAYTKDYTSAGLADVNSDGLDDLILGDEQAFLYLNNGHGGFAGSKAVELPSSPLPRVYSPVTKSKNDPRFFSIEPIVRTDGGPVDLITVSSPFYKGYAIQYLKNDGEGGFTEATDKYFHGAEMSHVSTSDENYVWMKRVFAYDRDGVQDIIARAAGGAEIASQVFLNHDGRFDLALTVSGYTIENAMEIDGKPVLLISNTQNLALMAYPR